MAQDPIAVVPAVVEGQLVKPDTPWKPTTCGQGRAAAVHWVVTAPHMPSIVQGAVAVPVKPLFTLQVPWPICPATVSVHVAAL